MAFDFPNSPTVGQAYQGYVWDGEKWQVQGSAMSGAVRFDLPQGLATTQQKQARDNIAAILHGHLFGLTLSTAGSSTTFSVAPGVAADSTSFYKMTLAAAISKTTAAWAVGTAAGALDTGAIAASTWYHVFLIQRPDTGVVDVLISLSATAPTLPANYTAFRRIGSMLTNASSQWVAFTQVGDEFMWASPPSDINTTTLGTTATLFTLSVPPSIQVTANIRGYFTGPAIGNAILFSSPDENATAASGAVGNTSLYTQVASGPVGLGLLSYRTNVSGQIRAIASVSGTTIHAATISYIDRRGKDY